MQAIQSTMSMGGMATTHRAGDHMARAQDKAQEHLARGMERAERHMDRRPEKAEHHMMRAAERAEHHMEKGMEKAARNIARAAGDRAFSFSASTSVFAGADSSHLFAAMTSQFSFSIGGATDPGAPPADPAAAPAEVPTEVTAAEPDALAALQDLEDAQFVDETDKAGAHDDDDDDAAVAPPQPDVTGPAGPPPPDPGAALFQLSASRTEISLERNADGSFSFSASFVSIDARFAADGFSAAAPAIAPDPATAEADALAAAEDSAEQPETPVAPPATSGAMPYDLTGKEVALQLLQDAAAPA